jgi:hypothetical protein
MENGSLRITTAAGLFNADENDPSKEAFPVIVLAWYLLNLPDKYVYRGKRVTTGGMC